MTTDVPEDAKFTNGRIGMPFRDLDRLMLSQVTLWKLVVYCSDCMVVVLCLIWMIGMTTSTVE